MYSAHRRRECCRRGRDTGFSLRVLEASPTLAALRHASRPPPQPSPAPAGEGDQSPGSGTFVLLIPRHRLPQLDLVAIQIEDPRELAVLVRFRTANRFDAAGAKLREQLGEIVHAVVDHERRIARAEPLRVVSR